MPTSTFHNLPENKQKRILTAAINEFAVRDYESALISNIIKEAQIPRGSFYQYFKDKEDLYRYIFQKIANDKIAFMSEELKNTQNLPFIDLISILYERGIAFALEYPKYIQISRFLFAKQDTLFDDIIRPNNELAIKYYQGYIENDQAQHRIRQDIDSYQLAKLIANLLMQTSTQVLYDHNDYDFDVIKRDVNTIISVLKKGIETDENNV